MTTSGPFADTHGLSGYEPNLTDSQFMVVWADTQNPSWSAIWSRTDFINPSWRTARNFKEEANAHKCRNMFGRTTCSLARARQTSLELATSRLRQISSRIDEQAACGKVHVAVAQASEMKQSQLGRLIKLYY